MPAIGQCTQMDTNRSNESENDEHNNLEQQPQELHSQSPRGSSKTHSKGTSLV